MGMTTGLLGSIVLIALVCIVGVIVWGVRQMQPFDHNHYD